MMTAYDVDAKAAELGHSIIGRPVQSYLRSILAGALREARETALREASAIASAERSAFTNANERIAQKILALLAPAETETPDAS